MIKSLLLLLPVIALAGCSHSPDPIASSDGYVGYEAASWKAWTNDMPFGPRSLHVVGDVTVSNGRYGAVMKPSPQTPGVHFRIEVADRGGMGTTALTTRNVQFIKTNYDGSDSQVTIHFPDGTTLDVPIESAQ